MTTKKVEKLNENQILHSDSKTANEREWLFEPGELKNLNRSYSLCSTAAVTMKRGDILVLLENDCNCLVLVVSPIDFNNSTKSLVILPIINGYETRRLSFAVPIRGIQFKEAVRLAQPRVVDSWVVRCDRPKAIDLFEHHAHKIDTLPDDIMSEVLAKVSTIFE